MSNRSSVRDLGRHVFGLAAVIFGVSGLRWGDFPTIWQPVQPGVPHRTALAYIAAACFLAGGLGVQWRRTARVAAAVLAVLYLLSAGLWLPRVIGFPQLFGTWSGFAEQFALAVAAVLVAVTVTPPLPVSAARAASACLAAFGVCAAIFGIEHFTALKLTAEMVPAWVPPGQLFWAAFTGAALLLGGLAIVARVRALLAAQLLTVLLMSFELFVWVPRVVARPHVHMTWGGNAITLAAAGAAWIVADAIGRGDTGWARSRARPA